jgi:hypothetical protein
MHQQIGILGMGDQVFVQRGVARQHGGAAVIIDAVTERVELFATVIDLERGDRDAIRVIDHALGDL